MLSFITCLLSFDILEEKINDPAQAGSRTKSCDFLLKSDLKLFYVSYQMNPYELFKICVPELRLQIGLFIFSIKN